ncbi:Uncharacterized HTH-type transcriptional regulator yjiR [Delftia tsuruhatensis]|uniref:aminotransferase-like domain-containing protein n=1 Tax=Delftia tsuruhatensis TaxID=180282 RepID=UPI001E7244D3|nr:PLP-dependent aminotransferase family protein [Delftia tsuruhatensis]CAB5697424.1 Uncharacterized HTH-type transcriptional regulator yjiR [Delftia tsuruhatensis]CAC9678739.1 Uncharacterized HTH-type transcriptional regulator yjiR [Delftia tsuruhatensis]
MVNSPSEQGASADMSSAPWIVPLRAGNGPRYLQIARMIGRAIEAGTLRPGDQIPTQRALASRLGVDLTTVTRAYAHARQQGWISATTGRGSFVARPTAAREDSAVADLGMNVPPTHGGLDALLRQGLDALLQAHGACDLSSYEPAAIADQVLDAGRDWLRPALGAQTLQQPLLLAAGTQAALCAILMRSCRQDDAVLCDPLTYPGFLLAARSLRLRIVPVQGDDAGMRPDALQAALDGVNARLLYLNPTLHNPTTRTMPTARRQAIAAVLRERQLTLIEDDPYRPLLTDAPAPLTHWTGGVRSFYVASLSKTIWPSLRMAFVLAPDQAAADEVQDCLRATGMGCSPLLAGLAAQWMASGQARRMVGEVQREARLRQAAARELLPQAQADAQGLHAWLPLPPHWTQQLFMHALQERGIAVAPAQAFAVDGQGPEAVRLSLGAAAGIAQLRTTLESVARLWHSGAARSTRARAVV